jgi:hypothetical protein
MTGPDIPDDHGSSVGSEMVKERKFLRKQADRAEQAASRSSDPERAANLRALATAFRSQADMMKRKHRKEKKKTNGTPTS